MLPVDRDPSVLHVDRESGVLPVDGTQVCYL